MALQYLLTQTDIFVRIWLDHGLEDHSYYAGYAALCVAYPILNSLSAM